MSEDSCSSGAPSVCVVSPCYHTTQGHRSIYSSLMTSLSGFAVYPLIDSLILSNHWQKWLAEQARPDVILVDFPDKGMTDALRRVKTRCRELGHTPLFAYLTMLPTGEGSTDFRYDVQINMEPGILPHNDPGLVVDLQGPLLRTAVATCLADSNRLEKMKALQCRYNTTASTLWFVSGTDDEQVDLEVGLTELIALGRHRPVYPSTGLPQSLLPYGLLAWSHILTAAGYSAFWELAALGLLPDTADRITFFKYHRPLEDCDGRLQLLTNRPDAVQKLAANACNNPQEVGEILRRALRDNIRIHGD